MKSKADIKPGDIIHMYHVFGYPEYRDCEGVVKFIDDTNGIHGTWGDLTLMFVDDWEIIEDK